jgi:preprotein translocase subunit SecD
VLFQFGSGSVKGFAVTLSIGIAASMFTAIFVSRTIFETAFSLRPVAKLSI